MSRALLLLGLLLCAGCAVGPDYHRPETPVPTAWSTFTPDAKGAAVTTAAPAELSAWWKAFDDPLLSKLVGEALGANLDLGQAEARLRQARAVAGVQSAGLWPEVDASGSYTRSHAPGAASGGTDLFRAGLDAAWELDLFGGTRRSLEAARADAQAALEDWRDVMVSLEAEVALDYVDLRGVQREIAIARENLAAQQHSADLTRQRFEGGFVGRLDVANARALVATTTAQIPLLEEAERQTVYRLSVLLGEQPTTLEGELLTAAPIPTSPPEVPIGLPSDLLQRRPDVRAAEARLHAATARVGVATADLFPRFSLTGSAGLVSDTLSGLFRTSEGSWSLGPSFVWPIFASGRIRAGIHAQDAAEREALLAYRATVLTALADVQSALVAYARDQDHASALEDAVAADREAVTLVSQLYSAGQTDFLQVLDAQRSLYAAEDALVQGRRTISTDLVALYKALGGGWTTPPEG